MPPSDALAESGETKGWRTTKRSLHVLIMRFLLGEPRNPLDAKAVCVTLGRLNKDPALPRNAQKGADVSSWHSHYSEELTTRSISQLFLNPSERVDPLHVLGA